MKRSELKLLLPMVVLTVFCLSGTSLADLAAMGPIDPSDGFPAFFTDSNGLSLAKCNVENLYSPNILPRVPPSNDPGTAPTWMCNLISTAGEPTCPAPGVDALVAGCYNDMQPIDPLNWNNFPFETFYFNATVTDSICPGGGCPGAGNTVGTSKRALLYLAAIEATFLTPTGAPPLNQPNSAATVFQRIRIDLDIPVAGTYVVKHPYPTVNGQIAETFVDVPAGTRAIKFTANFPAAGIPFSAVTTGPIGPFLVTAATEGGVPVPLYGAVTGAGAPIPGRLFIGDPNLKPGLLGQPPMTVTGSPVGQNFVSVCGPDPVCSVVNYRQNEFQLMGMLYSVNLDISKTGTGTGTVTSNPTGINCDALTSSCSAAFLPNTVVSLSAIPSAGGSIFSGWSGNPDCTDGKVTMTDNIACSAAFDSCGGLPAQVSSGPFGSIALAYGGALPVADTIQVIASNQEEILDFPDGKSVTLSGGYDCAFLNVVSYTVITGSLTVSTGDVTVENIVIR